MGKLRFRWVGPLVAVAIVAGAATGFAQLSDNFTNPAAPVPGSAPATLLRMTGAKTGAFTGGGPKGTIRVLGLENSITPGGSQLCQGINFRKPTDQATPSLFLSAATNEIITSAIFNEYGPSPKGTQALTLQIKATNGTLTSVHHVDATTTGAYDDVTLMPSRVTLTWEPSKHSIIYTCTVR